MPKGAREYQIWKKQKLMASQHKDYRKLYFLEAIAQGAMDQGAQGVERMARAGGSGSNPRNMYRDLKAAFGRPKGSPEFDWFNLPTEGR